MKKSVMLLVVAGVAMIFTSCKETKIQNVKMENASDSLSYAIGVNIGQSFKEQEILDVNTEVMAAVIKAILSGDTTALKMNDSSSLAFLNNYMRKKQELKIETDKQAGLKFLEENAKKPGVVVTPSGLQYNVISSGTGISPVDGDMVSIYYSGKFINGEEFDGNIGSGQPATLGVNDWITGLSEALKMMKEGDKWHLVVPSELAYGPGGYQGFIPPYSTLVFEVEMLKVTKGGDKPAGGK
ncbi:MAG: FKBP-type peptidyl-prolyl cis-trans isomerase [Chitinophagales bacterium]